MIDELYEHANRDLIERLTVTANNDPREAARQPAAPEPGESNRRARRAPGAKVEHHEDIGRDPRPTTHPILDPGESNDRAVRGGIVEEEEKRQEAKRGAHVEAREGEIPTEVPPHPPGPVTPGWSNYVAVGGEGGGVAAPVLTTLTPASAVLGSANFTLSCVGEGFTPDAVITFNGLDEPTTVVSPNEVTTGVDMAVWLAAATVPVTVRTGAGESAPLDFEFTAVGTQAAKRGR